MSLQFPIPSTIGQVVSQDGRVWVWDGVAYHGLGASGGNSVQSITAAVAATLNYITGGATSILALTTPDVNGVFYVLQPSGLEEPVDVYVDGVRLQRDFGAGGQYTVDRTTSTITFTPALTGGQRVIVDVLVPPDLAVVGSVNIRQILDLDVDWSDAGLPAGQKDGVNTEFALYVSDGGSGQNPINPAADHHIEVFQNGVRQRPGVDFTTGPAVLSMVEAPEADAEFWALWYEPAGDGGGGLYIPLSGGVMADGASITFDTTTAQAGPGADAIAVIDGDGGRLDNVVIDEGTF